MFEPNPDLIDYHCHLDLYQDYAQQFKVCESKRIATLAVTTTPRAWETNRNLAAGSKFVRTALGMHPQLVGEFANEIRLFERLLHETRYIGEVGLDASPRYYGTFTKQKEIFERILKLCGAAGGKILSVHCVRAGRQLLDLIEEHLPPSKGKVVLHWFSGTPSEAKRAIQLGCYFSINLEMFNNRDRHSLIASLPVSRILTETDGPFTSTGLGPSTPIDVLAIVPLLAKVVRRNEIEIAAQLVHNLKSLEA